MNEQQADKMIALLGEMLENQKVQMDRQQQALEMQKDQFEKAQALQDRAEVIQEKSRVMLDNVKRVVMVVLPVAVALLVFLIWDYIF